MSSEIFAPREFDSPPGEAAAGGEVTALERRSLEAHNRHVSLEAFGYFAQ
jgi:hypothetical protein